TKDGVIDLGSGTPLGGPGGAGGSPVVVGDRATFYRQKQQDVLEGTFCPVKTFSFLVKTQAIAQTWADEYFGLEAFVKIDAVGHVSWNVQKLEFSECPP